MAQKFTKKIKGPRGGESCEDVGVPPSFPELLKYVKEYRLSYVNVEYPPCFLAQYLEGGKIRDDITFQLERNFKYSHK